MGRILWLALLAVPLVACSPTVDQGRVEETLEESYALSPDGSVSVYNVNGKIRIEAWDRDEVRLVAVKKARSKKQLERLRIEIDHSNENLEIRTRHRRFGSDNDWLPWNWIGRNGTVNYSLKVPAGVELDKAESVNGSVVVVGVTGYTSAETVNGSVRLTEIEGSLRAQTVNGSITAQLASMSATESIRLNTVNGGVRLTLPGDADASILARSVNGGVSTSLRGTTSRRGLIGKSFSATIGSGSADIQIRTVNGGVTIRHEYQSASR